MKIIISTAGIIIFMDGITYFFAFQGLSVQKMVIRKKRQALDADVASRPAGS